MNSQIVALKYDAEDFDESFHQLLSSSNTMCQRVKIFYLNRFIYTTLLDLQNASIDQPLIFLRWFNEKHQDKIDILNKWPRSGYNWRNIKRFRKLKKSNYAR